MKFLTFILSMVGMYAIAVSFHFSTPIVIGSLLATAFFVARVFK